MSKLMSRCLGLKYCIAVFLVAVNCQNLFAEDISTASDHFFKSIVVPEIKPSAKPKRILFIGNSFSFYNNGIHNHLGSLIRGAGEWQKQHNRLRLSTLSGGHIQEHQADLAFVLNDSAQNWQAIVLQGHSNEPIHPKKNEDFVLATTRAIQQIKAKGIQPILFMTWAYKSKPNMGAELANVYTQLANDLDVLVVPVGLAFAEVEKNLKHIELFVPDVLGVNKQAQLSYRKDWKHPSEAGTYLAACVFYATLYQRSPEGLVFTAKLDKDTALALQKVSWDVTQQFFKRENNVVD